MGVVLWGVAAYLVGSVPSGWALRRMTTSAEIHLAGVIDAVQGAAVVALALAWGGLYAGCASAVGVTAGRWWPVLWRRHGVDRPWVAWGALCLLLPVETIGSSVVGLALRRRVWAFIAPAGLVPLLAVLRHQPAPHRLASAAVVVALWLRRWDQSRLVSVRRS